MVDIIDSYLENAPTRLESIYYSDAIQAFQTAEMISSHFNVPIINDNRIKPLDMGCVAGLSRDEAQQMYPEAAGRLDMWRTGRLEIRDLMLPGAESFDSFWNRGVSFIEEIATKQNVFVLVGTRSLLILLLNILLNRSPYKEKEYHPWLFLNGSVTSLTYDGSWNLIKSFGVTYCDNSLL